MAAKAEGIGSIRHKTRFLSPVWQIRLLVALRVSIGLVAGGFVIIYWLDFLLPIFVPFSVLILVIVLLVDAQYHLPGVVLFALDFVFGGIFASVAILISFYIYRHAGLLSYYYTIFVWIFTFLFTLADKFTKHVLMVKFGIIFYMLGGIYNVPPTPLLMAKEIYYIIVICLMFPSGIAIFVASILHPIFASHLIMPEIVEILRDFRNLQSLLAHHHVLRAVARAPNPPASITHQKEENWAAIGEIETRLSQRIERTKGYLKDSQIEMAWNKDNVQKYAKVFSEVEKLYWLLIGKRVSIAKYHPAFSPLDSLPLLESASTEIIKYLDGLVSCMEVIHKRSFRSFRSEPKVQWPTVEDITRARQELGEDFKETSRRIFEETHEVPFSTEEIIVLSSILSSMQAIGRQTQAVATMLQDVKPATLLDSYKHVPQALFFSLILGLKNLFMNDLGFGVIDQFKQKKSIKEHAREMIHSKRWRYPFRFATVVAATLVLTLWVIREYSTKLHITATNRSYFVITALLVIVPSQGSTIGRGLHRIVGTVLGVIVGYLVAWAALDASTPNEAARWIVMEFMLPSILFFGVIIQLIPGTGYAALLFNITIPLVSVAYLQSPIDRIPISVATTRIIFIAIASIWSVAAFCALIPVRSVNNLRLSLLNCLSTSGKAFSTIVECGLLHDRGTSQLSEEEMKVVAESFSTLHTANGLHKMLLLDTFFETLHERHRYHDYKEAVDHTRNLIQKLVLINTLYDTGFDESVTKALVIPLRSDIQYIMKPVSLRIAKVAEQRAEYAKRRTTSRATKIRQIPQAIREKMKARRERKRIAKEHQKNTKHLRSDCKDCRRFKDCEKHKNSMGVQTTANNTDSSQAEEPSKERY